MQTVFWEERIGSLVASGGIIWAAWVFFRGNTGLDAVWQTRGPLEICAIGILVWLHAKWRKSTTAR